MAILGLISTESGANADPTKRGQGDFYWTNIRRRVFYQYPNGAAPLIGLLSMMKEDETNDPEFSWWEKRLVEVVTTTAATAGPLGPFYRLDGTTTAGDPVDDGSAGGWLAGTQYAIKVVSTALFRVGHVIRLKVTVNSAASTFELRARVTSVLSSTVLKVIALNSKAQAAGIDNGSGENVGVVVQAVGTSFPQGVVDLTSEIYTPPVNVGNYTQIFRTPFSFTGTSLVTPVRFDDTGLYKDKGKENSMDHMIQMELALLFGIKTKRVPSGTSDPTTGVGLPIYTTGGIISQFLADWEAGSVYGNTAATVDTDDTKRVIANAAGTLNEATYDTYLERIFRTTSNVSNEKLVLCGTGFLKVINQMYRSLGVLQLMVPSQDTFGMEIVAHKTAFGTVYYKSHPLFSRNSELRNNALFCDIHNLRYRPVSKRDTQLLKNRQPNDADYRKDEWFTEAGFEVRLPEAFMYLQNVQTYQP